MEINSNGTEVIPTETTTYNKVQELKPFIEKFVAYTNAIAAGETPKLSNQETKEFADQFIEFVKIAEGPEAASELEKKVNTAAISQDTLDILYAFGNNLSVAGTPGSDSFQTGAKGFDYLFGREGNDRLLTVDDDEELPGKGEFDLIDGADNQDVFILGNRDKVYYDDGDPTTLGEDDFGLLFAINPEEDIVQLHGVASDYVLVEEGTDTSILLKGQDGGSNELIASIMGTVGLDINGDYFRFVDGDAPAADPELEQSVEQIGTSGQDIGFGTGIANDGSGAVLLTGYTVGALAGKDSGSLEGFLTKYSRAGNEVWSKQVGTKDNENGYGVTTDPEGNVYWVARTNGDLSGENAGIGNDVVISKYNKFGVKIWSQQFGQFGNDNPFVNPIVDPENNLYVAGYTNGDLFAPNANPGFPPNADGWVTKLDDSGNQIWATQFGTDEGDELFGLALGNEGNAYATGWTRGSLGAPNNLDPQGEVTYDVWLNKLDSNGNVLWFEQFGTNTFDWAWDIDVNANEEIYVTGWTLGNLGGTNFGSYDFYIAKYNTEGEQLWLKQFGTPGDEAAQGMELDSEGNLYLTGYITEKDGDGLSITTTDAWVAKFDPEGNGLWSKKIGTPGYDSAIDITLEGEQIYITGNTDSSLGSSNQGSYDAWLAKLSTDGSLLDFNSSRNVAVTGPLGPSSFFFEEAV